MNIDTIKFLQFRVEALERENNKLKHIVEEQNNYIINEA
jgi:FtsZ-binding cell division protein ZapB